MTSDSFIQLDNVGKTYLKKGQTIHVLSGIKLDIKKNSFMCILGPSGAGKTTLLHLLGLLDEPTTGDIFIDGQNTRTLSDSKKALFRNETMGFIFQNFNFLPELTLFENVCLPFLPNGKYTTQNIEFATHLLETSGLKHRLHHFPGELSGGELQRGAVIRSLVLQPKLVLADEPTGNLDSENTEIIFNLMTTFQKEFRSCFILVTHNSFLSDRIPHKVRLHDGRLAD